jgi:VanZ family protein
MLVYASLIPLQYRRLDWPETIERWKSIPWLQLGVYNRADWIANGLVVVPVSFLLTGAVSYRGSGRRAIDRLMDLGATTLVGVFLVALVLGIEMLQVWFPPRTVSWNDIVAGWIGTICGALLWLVGGEKGIEATSRFFRMQFLEDRLVTLAIVASVAGFLYSIYPLDLILNSREWNEKIRLGRVQWGLIPHSISMREWLQGLVVSAIRLIPFGVLTLRLRSAGLSWAWILVMGLLLELVQLPFFTKYSSFGDVLAGWMGGAFGICFFRAHRFWDWLGRSRWIWIGATAVWLCILVVAFLARSERWVFDPAELKLRWSGFFTYPLLRYYYTSEYSAVTNLLGKVLSFNVLGALVACCFMFGRRNDIGRFEQTDSLWRRHAFQSALVLAIPIGLIIEILQVYRFDLIGDLSDVGTYALGAGVGAWLTIFIVKGPASKSVGSDPQVLGSSDGASGIARITGLGGLPTEAPNPVRSIGPVGISTGLLLLVLGCWLAGLHPGWPVLQTLSVLAVFGLIRQHPSLFPMVYILSLTVADAYPWTGQLAVQEYDSLLLGCFAGLCFASSKGIDSARSILQQTIRQRIKEESLLLIGFALLALSVGISLVIGLVRLPGAPWGDQLSVYFTRWNAVRVAKGIGWGLTFAIAMLFLNKRSWGRVSIDWELAFLRGCTWAALYVGVFVAIERAIFPGLLNWSDVYRATGPFFTMHIGDQHLDAFLVMVFPLVWACTLHPTSRTMERGLCGLVLGLLAYGAFSTMSRATLATLLLQIAGLLYITGRVWAMQRARLDRQANRIPFALVNRAGLAAILLGLLFVLGLILAARTEALQSRFATNLLDWNGRVSHWMMILKRGTTGVGGTLIGHGVGTLPSLVASEFGRPVPPIQWIPEQGDSGSGQIALRGDWPIYLERMISGDAQKAIKGLDLEVELANESNAVMITPSLVEKSMLESFGATGFPAVQADRSWKRLGVSDLNRDDWDLMGGSGCQSPWRPWSFGLSASGDGVAMIRDAASGSIDTKSSYPWYFTCDDHMVWRAKNFLVHSYYEQGFVGVAAWSFLVLGSLWGGWRGMRPVSIASGRLPFGSYQAVSVLGFAGVGFFGSLVDTPWITALVLAILSMHLGSVPKGLFREDSP